MSGSRLRKALEQPATTGSANTLYFLALALIILGLFGGSGAFAAQPVRVYPKLIEVFTTTEISVGGNPLLKTLSPADVEIQIYLLDGIQRVEAQLSNNLPADPKQAHKIALRRLRSWDESTSAQLRQSAMGLAKALQYGIDRYPAIVFEGEGVVYGLTDLDAALDHYRRWRQGRQPR